MFKRKFGIRLLIICAFIYSNIRICETAHRLKNKDFGPKIVGGHAVGLEEYPFAVQFFNLGSLCGGVILNTWAVLTSAHCLDNNKNIKKMTVQVGSKYIYDFNAKKYDLSSYEVHEDYNKVIPFENDIAMLFVKKPIKFNKLAKKGILVNHNKWMNPKETEFIVTGWGWLKYDGALSEMSLMMASLTYVTVSRCSELHKIELSKDMFCLYGEGDRDTCRGDSGGGVLWNGRIVGLTSHGDGCAKKLKPSVYTNLWFHRKWIKEQMLRFIDNFCRQGEN
ncbi:hypothetical protein B5X24_HaOG200402 [Helicoverpa armigera]|nr:hypothetical protein B5X24_HaOG200402 [Helicoverpa armigera]